MKFVFLILHLLQRVPAHLMLGLPKPISETVINALKLQSVKMVKHQLTAKLMSFAYNVAMDGSAKNIITI